MKSINTLTITMLIVVLTEAKRKSKGWSSSRDKNGMSSIEASTTVSFDSSDDYDDYDSSAFTSTQESSSSWSKGSRRKGRKRKRKHGNGGRKHRGYDDDDDDSSEGYWSTWYPGTTDSYEDDLTSTAYDAISTTNDAESTTDDVEMEPVVVAAAAAASADGDSDGSSDNDNSNEDIETTESTDNEDDNDAYSDETDDNEVDHSAGMKVAVDNQVETHGVVFGTNAGNTMEWIGVIVGVIGGVALIACLIIGTLSYINAGDKYDNVAADDNEGEGVEFGVSNRNTAFDEENRTGKTRNIVGYESSGEEEDGDTLLTR